MPKKKYNNDRDTLLYLILEAYSGSGGSSALLTQIKNLLTAIDADTSNIPALGNAAMAASLPTTIASDDTIMLAIKTAIESQESSISLPKVTHRSPTHFKAEYGGTSTTITISALRNLTINDSSQIKYIVYIPSGLTGAGVLLNGVNGVTISISGSTITVDGAGTPFASGDVYEVGVNGVEIGDDLDSNSKLISNLTTEFGHNLIENISETLSVGAPTKYYYVFDMENYKGGSITFRLTTGAASTAVLKSYICNLASENTSTITIANWHDDSTDSLGAASIACGAAATTDHVIHFDTNWGCKYFMLEVDYTHGANSTLTINQYKN